jgi:hypothetical protein
MLGATWESKNVQYCITRENLSAQYAFRESLNMQAFQCANRFESMDLNGHNKKVNIIS